MRSKRDLVIYRASRSYPPNSHHAAVLGLRTGDDLEALLAQEAGVISHQVGEAVRACRPLGRA
jgi:hypothetical protein